MVVSEEEFLDLPDDNECTSNGGEEDTEMEGEDESLNMPSVLKTPSQPDS